MVCSFNMVNPDCVNGKKKKDAMFNIPVSFWFVIEIVKLNNCLDLLYISIVLN